MARWLDPAVYGAFSTAYAAFLLFATLHTALWIEPMLVYGSGRFRDAFGAYQKIVIRYHWFFTALPFGIFLVLGIGLEAFGQEALALSFLSLALAAPAILYLWVVRSGVYVVLEPRFAALGGGFYLLIYFISTFFFYRLGLLNEVTAFLAMGAAAFLAAEGLRLRLKTHTDRPVDPKEVRMLHWSYGRWSLLAGLFSWVPGNIYYIILPAFHGLEAAAQFKALMNLLMPILHFNSGFSQLLVPGMVRARGAIGRFVRVSLTVICSFAMLYWVLLVGMGRRVMGWLYGGRYLEVSVWLPWLGLLPFLVAIIFVTGALLRAQERSKAVALGSGLVAGFAATAGVALVWGWGLDGAVGATLLTETFSAVIFLWLSKGEKRKWE